VKYVVHAKSPDTANIKGRGSWVVEAESREEAIFRVSHSLPLGLWPPQTEWTVKRWNERDSPPETSVS
jgi:hypothetical protein